MKVVVFIALAVLVAVADAHTMFSSITVGGVAQPNGDCMRPHPTTGKDSPISSVTSPDMTCGFLPAAAGGANRKCPVQAGSKVGLQWWHITPGDDVIDSSHKGPCMVYLAKSDTGAGNVWFKIYEDGYDATSKKWCVDRLVENRGYFEATIPADIAPGNYLLRGEVIALHGAYDVGGAQPYVHCAEITITGSGTATPAAVALPGAYTDRDPGIFLSVYYPEPTNYIIPGPRPYVGTGGGGGGIITQAPNPNQPATTTTTTTTTTAAPTARTTLVAYEDAVTAPFEDWSWASTKNTADTTYKYAGSASFSFAPVKYQAAFFHCSGCIDPAVHESIEFYINGGTTGGQSVTFNLLKGTAKTGNDFSVNKYTGASSIAPNTWAKGTVSLSAWPAGKYDGFWFQDASNANTAPIVYLDSIRVIAKVSGNSGNPTTAPNGNTVTNAPANTGTATNAPANTGTATNAPANNSTAAGSPASIQGSSASSVVASLVILLVVVLALF